MRTPFELAIKIKAFLVKYDISILLLSLSHSVKSGCPDLYKTHVFIHGQRIFGLLVLSKVIWSYSLCII